VPNHRAAPICLSSVPELGRVTVIVVTFHSRHCIAPLSLGLKTCPHIVVVDNASNDDVGAVVLDHLPQAQVIVNERNLGFGAANNKGVAQASTEFVLLLNPDCLITPEAIHELVRVADLYPDAAMVAPQLVDRAGAVQLNLRWKPGTWAGKLDAVPEGDVCVGFASGACMLIRRSAMQAVQGFDEEFFLYYEDDDLCARLSNEVGPIVVAAHARVAHYSRGSSAGRARWRAEYNRGYHHIQSKFLFADKHLRGQDDLHSIWLYALAALLECIIRGLLLDWGRAVRVFGRVVGAVSYKLRPLRAR
jgi:N-acetylglucosaminyl-diphospho-decaprenol L-rhamnosyltransferase